MKMQECDQLEGNINGMAGGDFYEIGSGISLKQESSFAITGALVSVCCFCMNPNVPQQDFWSQCAVVTVIPMSLNRSSGHSVLL
jgi:hypothetical protein